MKRALAFLLALAMVFSLSLTAFADETGSEDKTTGSEDNTIGSITVSNATKEKIYKLYKLFDASVRYKTNAEGEKEVESISYSITPDNPYFEHMFPEGATQNEYFVYNPNTTAGNLSVKENTPADLLIKYLEELVKKSGVEAVEEIEFTGNPNQNPDDPTDDDDLVFDGLEPGYYLITSSLNTTVTLTSNTPNVTVIDKNQTPGSNLDKQVEIGKDDQNNILWGEENSANIGDSFQYKISLQTTNYDEDKKIMYYQIHDEKGDAIWAEFNSIRVSVGGVDLPRGYYLSQGGENSNNWEFLGDVDENKNWVGCTEAELNPNNAQWYLVHLGFDKFRITIPWLENHTLEYVTDSTGNVVSYKVNFDEEAEPIYPSPSNIEVTYTVAMEANAAIGPTTHGNRFNRATASWTSTHETTTTPPDEVVTSVYGVGILKDDLLTKVNLAGAKFVLYRTFEDLEYSNPVHVIPTGIEGVYAVDTNGSPLDGITGDYKVTSREHYATLKDDEGNSILDAEGNEIPNQALAAWGDTPKFEMVTPKNGKLVVLGLEAGSYYLVETDPPAGYNPMSGHALLEVGEDARPFMVYANKEGKVADIQTEDAEHSEFRYEVTQAVIHNSKGTELPATGGAGRMMLLTVGSLVAMAFAVLMITQKKMSIYKD